MFRIVLLLCAFLAACASPVDRCIKSATTELRTVNALIAETEANIARGYRYVTEPRRVRVGVSYCSGRHGNIRFCGDSYNDVVRRPVAVDTAEETRKLASLKTKQTELRRAADPAIAACQSRYGSAAL